MDNFITFISRKEHFTVLCTDTNTVINIDSKTQHFILSKTILLA